MSVHCSFFWLDTVLTLGCHMSFQKTMSRLVGFIDIAESATTITVTNVPVKDIERMIFDEWRSSKITGGLFLSSTRNSFTIPRFFAIELAFVIEHLLANSKRLKHARALRRTLELLYAETWLQYTRSQQPDILNFDLIKRMRLKPLPHQAEFFQTYNRVVPRYNLNGFLLSSPPGTGKTYTGLALSVMLEADVVIIIAPNNSVYSVWDKSIKTLIDGATEAWVSRNNLPLDAKHKYYIFHYESIGKAVELAGMLRGSQKRSVVILDESHNFNEVTASRTEQFVRLCKTLHSEHVLWSSGTPIKAIGNEAIPLLRTIDPYFDEATEQRFKTIFGKDAKHAINILAHRIGLVTYKVAKDTVVDIKPIIETIKVQLPNGSDYTLATIRDEMTVFIKERTEYYKKNMTAYVAAYESCLKVFENKGLSPSQHEEYARYRANVAIIRKEYDPVLHKTIAASVNAYEKNVILPVLPNAMKHVFRDSKSVVKYVHLKIQGECLGRVLGKKRSKCNVDMVRQTDVSSLVENSIKKTIVFTSYVDVVKEMDLKLKDEGFKTCLVYGETNRNVTQIVKQFEEDVDTNPLIATFDSLSTAVPLTVANTIVMMNSPFRHYEFDQAVSRCARLGQDTQVYVYMVVLDTGNEPNISTRAKDIMEWSLSQVEAIMGVKVDRSGSDLEVTLEAMDLCSVPAAIGMPKALLW